jgi:hypothetical protein
MSIAVSLPEINNPKREIDSPPSSAEVKNEFTCSIYEVLKYRQAVLYMHLTLRYFTIIVLLTLTPLIVLFFQTRRIIEEYENALGTFEDSCTSQVTCQLGGCEKSALTNNHS